MKSLKPFTVASHALIFTVGLLAFLCSTATLIASPLNLQSKHPVVHRSTPIFIFYDDEFWLNLHHFLYVLGRAQNKTRDSARAAVSGAPADQQQGMTSLTAKEQTVWQEAVQQYADGPSRKDVIFDAPLPAVTIELAQARNAKSLPGTGVDPAIAAVLVRGAPIYRKAWWPKHQAANKAWRVEIQGLVKLYGAQVLSFITSAYQMQWSAKGYVVHISAYCNWAGAYSVTGKVLVLSSLSEANHGTTGLEIVFHEGMHQWDDLMDAALLEQARRINKPVPKKISHALVFFTAGEAVRRVVPGHIPYADKSGVWQRGMTREREALIEIWKPYLDGQGPRDEAFAKLINRLTTEAGKKSP